MAKLMLPLISVEFKAIACGTLGHLCSIWALMCAAGAIIGFFTQGTGLTGSWRPLAVAAVVMALLRGPLAYGEQLLNHQMAFSTLRDIRTAVFDKMRALAPAKLQERGRGNLVTVITNDIELLEIFYAHTLSPICIAIVTALVNTIVLVCLNPQMGLAAFLCYLVIGLVLPFLSAKSTFRVALAERNAQGALHSQLLESLDGRRELVGLGAAAHTRDLLADSTQDMLDARSDTEFNSGWNNVFTQTATLIAFAVVAALGWFVALSGSVSFPALIVAFVGFISSFAPLVSVARLGTGLQPTLAAARRVFSLMDEQPAVQENAEGLELGAFTGISAQGLTFSHASSPNEAQPVISGISFDIRPGSVVGIQGENGAGKSTLIDLLMRFRERTGGNLTISGQPIEAVRTADLRRMETLVSQDTFIFTDTLAGNIAIAQPDASRDDIAQAAQQAHLTDVIAQLPGGLDHTLTANGSELSEGQKQRLAVARAFLSQAPFIALDEPTSNMDALLEGQIIEALLESQAGKTYLIVSHRPAVLSQVQQLYTLEDGQLTPAN
ncbi:putative ABC transporter ATP-binding protein [Bombiscardovia nodaiensis]|uniref:ABC transporter ATP-binding protein n=1 Tax=Bombiscardovia nodaiensis TaxID=2932181 RepID=A0ABN6SBF2_9BIFI|nr:putative ABC transporter ATP-binding protein [Bombiscardovia nodaiensis]